MQGVFNTIDAWVAKVRSTLITCLGLQPELDVFCLSQDLLP